MLLWICVALRIVANPCSNVFQKLLTRRGADSLFIVCATHGLLTVICLPFLIHDRPRLPLEFWIDMVLCTALAVAGNVFLVAAVRRADLSVLGPINSYKSVVSLVQAWLLLGEVPSLPGLGGVVLILAGSLGLTDRTADQSRSGALWQLLKDRGVQFRIAALVLSASDAVVFKRALLRSNALTAFAVWGVLGFCVSSAILVLRMSRTRRQEQWRLLATGPATYGMLFASTGLMQFCTAVTLEQLQVGYTLALFQISTLLSVILGHQLFQERDFLRRFTGAIVMVAGAVLIIVSR